MLGLAPPDAGPNATMAAQGAVALGIIPAVGVCGPDAAHDGKGCKARCLSPSYVIAFSKRPSIKVIHQGVVLLQNYALPSQVGRSDREGLLDEPSGSFTCLPGQPNGVQRRLIALGSKVTIKDDLHRCKMLEGRKKRSALHAAVVKVGGSLF